MKVFYNERQSTDKNVSDSPSAGKPKALVNYWLSDNQPIDLISDFDPLVVEDFYRVHDARFVDKILSCQQANGFGNKLPEVAATLPWTNGSLYAAAEAALTTGENTCSPTSGFHHAGYKSVLGYCTFNGLMITVAKLINDHGVNKIGIIDLDMHWGNGTIDILEEVPELTDKVPHYTFGALYDGSYTSCRWWKGGPTAQKWVDDLPNTLKDFADCDLIIYQAGADPHKDDPQGGALTDEQLRQRDAVVFELAKKWEVPVVWNLAGGYQEPLQKVLDIHTRTLKECVRCQINRTSMTTLSNS